MPRSERHAPSLSPRGLAVLGWCALALAGWLFFTIAWDVASHAKLVVLDARVAAWLHTHGHPALTALMLAVSQVNSVAGISIMTALFAAVLARRREWYWLSSVLLSVLGGIALNAMLKQAYQRARPHFDDPLVSLASFSFPSGHTAGAAVFYGVLAAYLVSRHFEPRRRIAIIAVAILAVVLVAFSRMYLGAHYLSDVAAAAASSIAWLALCLSAVRALRKNRSGGDAA